jgi:hypothetical protein
MQEEDGVARPDVSEEDRHVAGRVGPAPGGYQRLRGAEDVGARQRPEAALQAPVLSPQRR